MNSEIKTVIGIVFATVVIIGGGIFLWQRGNPTDSLGQKIATHPEALVRSDSHIIGKTGSKVTVVEFGDYQCPACGLAYPVVKKMLETYKDNPEVSFVFRNYPLLSVHPNAEISAEAAEAAAKQGKFWEMHEMLYEHQNDWAELPNPISVFEQYANTIGIDGTKLKADLDAHSLSTVVEADQADGDKLGINSTPTFFVNNVEITQVPSFDTLDQMIKKALSDNAK